MKGAIFDMDGLLLDTERLYQESWAALAETFGLTHNPAFPPAVAGTGGRRMRQIIREYYPDVEVHIEHAESLSECRKMLMLAKAGKKNGCLIEGMACPGGCIAGAGTNIAIPQAAKAVGSFQAAAKQKIPDRN